MQDSINNQSMLKVGTILRGTYRIDSNLSSGGFGNTYVATNIEFEERVAVKEFFMKGVTHRDDNQTTISISNAENRNSFLEQKEKFKKEARRIRQLQNEHIVKVHDLFEENGTAYYAMDFVDGENLSERLKRTGRPMTETEVREILPQILDALKAVHNEGFCHLDIKPSNIMLEKGGKIKLIDFGASKQLGANGTLTTNAPTAFAQTPGYAPREQTEQNLNKIGPWTDIYALGATFYNLLTNRRPPLPSDIDDDTTDDKHIALPFPDSVSSGMKHCILQMMSTNRNNRPQSMAEVESLFLKNESKNVGKALNEDTAFNNNVKSEPFNYDEETIIADPKLIEQERELDSQTIKPQAAQQITSENKSIFSFKWFNLEDERIRGAAFLLGTLLVLCIGSFLSNGSCRNSNQASNNRIDNEAIQTFDDNKVFDEVEEMPQYPGGSDALLTFLQNNINYPTEAEKKGINGKVIVSFIVGVDGSVEDVSVVTPVHKLLDAEAVRVIKSMPKWIPGKMNGSVVRVRYTVPINFKLE